MDKMIDYNLEFSDRTIIEANGDFNSVKDIMEKETFANTWMIRSNLHMITIMHKKIFEAFFVLHFYHNGNIYIIEYKSTSGNLLYNPDIRGLAEWAKNNGWIALIPHVDVIRTAVEFWKHFWDANLIESDYFEKHFSEREKL